MRVRITIDGGALGDLEAEVEHLGMYSGEDELRFILSDLLAKANGKVSRAYELHAKRPLLDDDPGEPGPFVSRAGSGPTSTFTPATRTYDFTE